MNALKITAALAAFVAGNALTTASAADWYGKISVGQSEAEIEGFALDEGTSYGAAIGTSVGPVRVEAGVDRISGDFAGIVNADALVYSGSAYFDLPVGDHASLFVGGGLDYVDGEGSVPGFTIDAEGDGYHYGAGGAYRLSENIIGEVSYRHLTADLDTDFGGVELEVDVVSVGLRLAL